MSSTDRGIDHVAVLVRDLDAAKERFESLGFTLTPRAYHPWGTANHLVQFGRSFIEIVGIADASKIIPHTQESFSFSAHSQAILEKREGMAMIVFSSEDAKGDTQAWTKAGLHTYEPVYFERGAKLPDGEEVKVAFTVSFVTNESLPDCAFFVCEQHFPQYFWKPDYQSHANGAAEIGRATLSIESAPEELAGFVHDLTGVEPGRVAGGVAAKLGWGALELLTADACVAQYPLLDSAKTAPANNFVNLCIDVDDVEKAADIVANSGIKHSRAPTYIDIAPDELFGVGMRIGQA